MKKKEGIKILYSFTPSVMTFRTIWMPKVNLAISCHKKLVPLNHSYLKYALETTIIFDYLKNILENILDFLGEIFLIF